MICIDDELIQRYIDGETDSRETDRIEKHLSVCSQCTRNIEEQRAFVGNLKKQMENWVGQPVIIPEFTAPVSKKRGLKIKFRHMMYAASAACAAFLLFFPFSERNEQCPEDEIYWIYSVVDDFDANRTVSQQETTIIMIDAHGRIVEY